MAISVTTTCIRAMLVLCTCLTLSGSALAATYWVSPAGAAAWNACTGATDPAVYCSLATANTRAAAGDTVYLKGGTYTLPSLGCGICPSSSGSSGNLITFSAAAGETPIITGPTNQYSTDISGKSYIKIYGLTFQDVYRGEISGSSRIEISHCTFTNPSHVGVYNLQLRTSTHVWIHHSTFAYAGNNTDCSESWNNLNLGNPSEHVNASNPANEDYNTIENNTIYSSQHAGLETFGRYTVIKNNVWHNEPWRTVTSPACNWPNGASVYTNPAYANKYGHRNLQIYGHWFTNYITFNLFEDNRVGYGSANPGNDGADNLALTSEKNIIRYNFFYAAMNNGIYIKNGGDSIGNNNRIFNNTFYHNGYGYSGTYPGGGFPNGYESNTGIAIVNTSSGNVIKNNLAYDDYDYSKTYRDIQQRFGGSPALVATVVNNWLTGNGNPSFTNPDVTDVTSATLPDLRLRAGSGAIDGGTYLTTAVGAGSSSTSLVVADAQYFQDGTWGSDLTRGVTLFPDWIAIGTVTNTVQISSINYATNTITLASPKTWSNGASIWLYKKSDGAVVLAGAGPDFGASEFGAGTPPLPPTNLQGVVR